MSNPPSTALNDRRVIIIGQGYVGLPVAMRAVEVGYDVIGFDVDVDKIDGLRAGVSHVDDITDADVRSATSTGRYEATGDPAAMADFDIAVITVPTPLRDGVPDLSFIRSAGELIAPHLRTGATVVLESTTYPGTTDTFLATILEDGSKLQAGTDFHLGFSPERIDPGNLTWGFKETPKVVSGIDAASLEVVQRFYDDLVDETVATVGTREAEMTKLLENTFRHVNIALVNELAVNAKALGIDFWNVIDAAKSKPFGFMPFYPGPGVGGHCLPIDPTYLSWQFERELGTVSRFVKTADDINRSMPGYVVERVQAGLNQRRKPVNGSTVLVLGISYKADSRDARETPATAVVEGLCDLGANVIVHDPVVTGYALDERASWTALDASTAASADCVVLLAAHSDVDYALLDTADFVFDTRRTLTGENVEFL